MCEGSVLKDICAQHHPLYQNFCSMSALHCIASGCSAYAISLYLSFFFSCLFEVILLLLLLLLLIL